MAEMRITRKRLVVYAGTLALTTALYVLALVMAGASVLRGLLALEVTLSLPMVLGFVAQAALRHWKPVMTASVTAIPFTVLAVQGAPLGHWWHAVVQHPVTTLLALVLCYFVFLGLCAVGPLALAERRKRSDDATALTAQRGATEGGRG